jgi:uncharacterized iron-regulated protein
MFDVIAKTSC